MSTIPEVMERYSEIRRLYAHKVIKALGTEQHGAAIHLVRHLGVMARPVLLDTLDTAESLAALASLCDWMLVMWTMVDDQIHYELTDFGRAVYYDLDLCL